MTAQEPSLLQQGAELIYREGMLLDLHRWDEWLSLYTEDCIYWMPMWRNDTVLNDDPDTMLSHIYYDARTGLEDRIARIRSMKDSPASTPIARTAHICGNVLALEPATPARMRLHASWACHVLFTRARQQHVFFGSADYTLVNEGDEWRIARKKIVLQNDDIPTMLDVYCV